MSKKVLHAFLMELLCLSCSHPTVKGYLDSFQHRHRANDLPSPLRGSRAYQRLCRTLSRFQGRQVRYEYPIHRSLVVKVLAHRPSTLAG